MDKRKESGLLTILTGIRKSLDGILENSDSDLTAKEVNCLNGSAGKIIEIERALMKKSAKVVDELEAITIVESLIEARIDFSLDFIEDGDVEITTSKEGWNIPEKSKKNAMVVMS